MRPVALGLVVVLAGPGIVEGQADPAGALGAPPRDTRYGWRRLWEVALVHPIVVVVAVGTLLRLTFALLSFRVNHGYLIGDEVQYVELAKTVASGRSAEDWFQFYGQSLYEATWAFTATLRLLFDVFWPSRFFGQLLAAAGGVVTAVLTTRLCLEFLARRWALLAGLLVAAWPSQVLWSSVVLRESLIWAALSLVALALAISARLSGRRLTGPALAAATGLWMLGSLRSQTMVAAAWALALAAPFVARRWRVVRTAGAVALALYLPSTVALGPGGWVLVQRAVPSLATTRTQLSLDAESSFVPATKLTTTTMERPRPTTTAEPGSVGGTPDTFRPRPGRPSRPGPGPDPSTTTTRPTVVAPPPPPEHVVVSGSGQAYVVEESVESTVEALPRGTVAVLFRPFPWDDAGDGLGFVLARFEASAWYVLYLLGGIGLVASLRRNARVLLFCLLACGAIVVVAAATQGNLGTAFRHRAQILWALAVFAATGCQEVSGWWAARQQRRVASSV